MKYSNLNVLQLVCPAFRLKYSNYTPYIEYFPVYKAYSGFGAESATWACETMFGVPAGALFNFYNRLIDGYGVRNTAEFRLTAGKGLADSGYGIVAEQMKQ